MSPDAGPNEYMPPKMLVTGESCPVTSGGSCPVMSATVVPYCMLLPGGVQRGWAAIFIQATFNLKLIEAYVAPHYKHKVEFHHDVLFMSGEKQARPEMEFRVLSITPTCGVKGRVGFVF
jgi:hypothetical protein